MKVISNPKRRKIQNLYNRLKTKLISYGSSQELGNTVAKIINNRSFRIIISIAFLLYSALYVSYSFTEEKIRKKFFQTAQIQNFLQAFIKIKFGKSSEIGIINFSLAEGLIIEDIKISGRDDFSTKNLMFHSKRLVLPVQKIFSANPFIGKAIFEDSVFNLDLDQDTFLTADEFLKSIPIGEIYFSNVEIKIKKGGKMLYQSYNPLSINIKNIMNGNYQITLNEKRRAFILSDRIIGSGHYLSNERKFSFNLKITNYNARNWKGIIEELYKLTPENGKLNGNILIETADNEINAKSQFNFDNITGRLLLDPEIFIEKLNFSENFGYSKIKKDPKKEETILNRELVSDIFKLQYKSNSNAIEKTSELHLSVTESEQISKKINHPPEKIFPKLKGKIHAELSTIEPVKEKNKFKATFSIVLSGIQVLIEKNKTLSINLDKTEISLDKNGKFSAISNGKIFDTKYNLLIAGTLGFYKLFDRYGNQFLPVVSNLILTGEFNQLRLHDYLPLADHVSEGIRYDIDERLKKVLDDNYFIYTPFYKEYVENLNLKGNVKFQNIILKNPDTVIGNWLSEFEFSRNSNRILFYKTEDPERKNKISLMAYHNTKQPYIDLQVSLREFPWQGKTYSRLCGKNISTENMDLSISFTGVGNNFYEIYTSRRIAGDVKYVNATIPKDVNSTKVKSLELGPFSFLAGADRFQYSYYIDAYSGTGYKKDILIGIPGTEFKGYSAIKNEQETGSFYSLTPGLNQTFYVFDDGFGCIRK